MSLLLTFIYQKVLLWPKIFHGCFPSMVEQQKEPTLLSNALFYILQFLVLHAFECHCSGIYCVAVEFQLLIHGACHFLKHTVSPILGVVSPLKGLTYYQSLQDDLGYMLCK